MNTRLLSQAFLWIRARMEFMTWRGTSWSGWQTGTRKMHIETLRQIPRGRRPAVLRSSGGGSEEHTSELQSRLHLVCRLLLEKKKKNKQRMTLTVDNQHTHN